MNKKAQAGGLIGIIALILIFYLLFIPPEERAELLKEEPTLREIEEITGKALLTASPGVLTKLEQTSFDHDFPNIVLSEERQAAVLAQINPFRITKGLFSQNFKTTTFTIPDLKTIDNVVLSFQATTRRGILKILLNDVPIFEGEVKTRNPQPIVLPKALLKQTNTLEFQVMGFSLFFKREYSLEDIKIIGEIIDVKKQQSAHAFGIPAAEYESLESGYISFAPVCDQKTIGILDVVLNDKIIFSATPDCNTLNRQDVFKDDLVKGKNALGFKLSQGIARLEQIRLKTIVKPTKGFSDYFQIDPKVYTEIVTGKARIVLNMEFVDDGKLKEAKLNINNKLDAISQRANIFFKDISGEVQEGNNFISIEPITDLNIIRLEVRVE